MISWAKKQTGFAIVELLIVVVVIAILAAITIVAYNGIQERTKASALQSTASQAAKKLELYYTTNNSTYPNDKSAFLAATGLSDAASATYDYYVSVDQKNYCVSVSRSDDAAGRFSQVKTSLLGSPVQGRCAVNYARTPYPPGGSWTGYNAAGGSTSSYTSSALDGRDAYRWTASAAGFSASSTVGLEYTGTGITISGGAQLSPSLMVRASKAGTYRLFTTFFNGTTGLGDQYGPTVSVAANTWTELAAASITAPPTADRMSIRAQYMSGTAWAAGDWYEVTKVSTAAGITTYGDNRTDGWFWLGAANVSPSVGPASNK